VTRACRVGSKSGEIISEHWFSHPRFRSFIVRDCFRRSQQLAPTVCVRLETKTHDSPKSFLRSGIARVPFVTRGLPERLSPLGDCPSSFLRSGIARVPFVTRESPERLSPLGDCPSTFRHLGVARAPFYARGLPEHLSSLENCLSMFHRLGIA
jgi:hypothetical protein